MARRERFDLAQDNRHIHSIEFLCGAQRTHYSTVVSTVRQTRARPKQPEPLELPAERQKKLKSSKLDLVLVLKALVATACRRRVAAVRVLTPLQVWRGGQG